MDCGFRRNDEVGNLDCARWQRVVYHTLRSGSVKGAIGRDAVPLDDLVSVIETLKARLETHRQVLQANETRTRMALIDPLLQALGWDTADPALVLPEYDLRGNRADYALLDGTATPVAFVEAKHLGMALASHREQIVRYAVLSGVPYAGLTDGDHWELYRAFNPSPFDRSTFEDRLLLNISIADRPAHEVALKLLLLWQPNLSAGEPVASNEPVLATPTESEVPRPETEPEVERLTTSPPAPIDDGDSFAAMASAIIEKLPVGKFKSTDCLPIIREGWPDHSMVSMSAGRFGVEFNRKLRPLLEARGVITLGDNPRRYEMTERAKGIGQ